MNPILSIDFDFWIPVRAEYMPTCPERGGAEDHTQWKRRTVESFQEGTDLRNEVQLSRGELPLPSRFTRWLAVRNTAILQEGLAIADQHFHAFYHFSNVSDAWLVHVDAHHDCGYGHSYDRPLDCGNWILRLAELGNIRKLTMIYPSWRRQKRFYDETESPAQLPWVKKLGIDLEVFYGLNALPEQITFAKSILVRSGGYSPPWLDREFLALVKSISKNPPAVLETTPIRELDFAECRRIAEWRVG